LNKFKLLIRGFALLGIVGLISSCGGGNSAGVVEYNIGNDVEFSNIGGASANFLSGPSINVPEAATLVRLALITKTSGQNVKMALYKADGAIAGDPGTLVAETASTLIAAAGRLEIPVLTAVALPAGDYIIVAVYDTLANPGQDSAGSLQANYFRSLTFADPIPGPFGTVSVGNLPPINYYMVVNNS